jgi:hypothetical protein
VDRGEQEEGVPVSEGSTAISRLFEYISTEEFQKMDDAWQHIGAMLNRMIDRAEDFCKNMKR